MMNANVAVGAWPGDLLNDEQVLDNAYQSLNRDIKLNVPTDQAGTNFVQNWNGDLQAWSKFYGDNDSRTSILITGVGTVAAKLKQYQSILANWQARYNALTGKAPAAPIPSLPSTIPGGSGGGSDQPFWTTSTIVLFTLGGVAVASFAIWMLAKSYERGERTRKELLPYLPAILSAGRAPVLPHHSEG